MTIRSMPPASSHLAERPVPAPPPMIGSPRAILPRSLARMSWRAKRGMAVAPWSVRRTRAVAHAGDFVPCRHQRVGEGLVVDVQWQALQLAVQAGTEVLLDGREQRTIGRRVEEGLAA